MSRPYRMVNDDIGLQADFMPFIYVMRSFRGPRSRQGVREIDGVELRAVSLGVLEGFNCKAKLTTREAFGFRTPQGIEIALVWAFGPIADPAFTNGIL